MSSVETTRPEARFQPVVIGSDVMAYGMARSFYEAYGVKTISVTQTRMAPTEHSVIVDVRLVPDLHSEQGFLQELLALADEWDAQHPDVPLVLHPIGDRYAALASKFQPQLSARFQMNVPAFDLVEQLVDKASFYRVCDEHGLPYPDTVVIEPEDWRAGSLPDPPFGYPRVVKPADSVAYLAVEFEGRKKAFIVDDAQQYDAVVRLIFEAGYQGTLIVQDAIPGSDEAMRVLNGYVNSDGSVAMLCLGHPLMESYEPALIGNYLAIVSEGDQAIYDAAERFLRETGYRGFVNFDVKFDERDGTFKFFELNPRAGGSSFYVTLAGYNLGTWLVEDLIRGHRAPTVYGTNEVLWLGAPFKAVQRFLPPGPQRERAERLYKSGRWGATAFYSHDRGFSRMIGVWRSWMATGRRLRQTFGHREFELTSPGSGSSNATPDRRQP